MQALAVVQAFRSEWPVLIVAPVSLKDNWVCEAHQWLGVVEQDSVVVSTPLELERARLQNVPMVIANYELLSKAEYAPGKFGGGQHLNFKVVICDESHRIKNHKVHVLIATTSLCNLSCRALSASDVTASGNHEACIVFCECQEYRVWSHEFSCTCRHNAQRTLCLSYHGQKEQF